MMAKSAPEDNVITQLFAQGITISAKSREVVARGDDTDSWIYWIEKGFVKEYSINDGGKEYLQLIYKAGELFPISWATAGIRKRLFYETLDDSVLRKLPKREFIAHVQAGAGAINIAVFQLMGTQFSAFVDRLDNLQYNSAKQRIIYRLLFLAGRFGEQKDGKIIIQAPLNYQLIADSINLTRETVSREAQELIGEGLIITEGRRIVITDLKGLFRQMDEPVSLDHWDLG